MRLPNFYNYLLVVVSASLSYPTFYYVQKRRARCSLRDWITQRLNEIKPWDYSWDLEHGIDEGSNSLCEGANKPYYKLYVLVRHGQYDVKAKHSGDKVLTETGWKQAYAAGWQLSHLGLRIDRIIHSDLIRARQTTAGLLAGVRHDTDRLSPSICTSMQIRPCRGDTSYSQSFGTLFKANLRTSVPVSFHPHTMISLPYLPYPDANFDCQESRLLAEGPPLYDPEPPIRSTCPDSVRDAEGRRIEAGYQAFFHRKPLTSAGQLAIVGSSKCTDSCNRNCCRSTLCTCACHRLEAPNVPLETIVIVGHANVFRYWLCRALQLPPEAWLRLSLYHGSLTYLMVRHEPDPSNTTIEGSSLGKSTVTLTAMGDVGHLPVELLTR